MIQRVQSIYLFLAALVSAGLIFVFPLYIEENDVQIWAIDDILYLSFFMGSTFLSLFTLFMFKNRKLQFVLGRLNIILNFLLLGLLVYRAQLVSGGTAVPEKGIAMVIPLVSIVFIALANRAVKKDEDLVKSVDRLR